MPCLRWLKESYWSTGKWDKWTDTLENKLLKRKTLCYPSSNRSCFTWRKIETDAKMNFYTGIQTIEMFNVIFIFIKPYLQNICLLDSTNKTSSDFNKNKEALSHKKFKEIER